MQWRRRLRRRIGRTRRYLQILAIARRHRLSPRRLQRGLTQADGRAALGRSLHDAMDESGVTFVKLGQLLSTRHDLLPPELIAEFSRLRDQAAPVPWVDVAAVLTEEIGPPPEVFASIEEAPIASASIAQVHLARLPTGEQVAVKVRRPGIGPAVDLDLDILAHLAQKLETRAAWARSFGVRDLADGRRPPAPPAATSPGGPTGSPPPSSRIGSG